jgi:hypothetical protein
MRNVNAECHTGMRDAGLKCRMRNPECVIPNAAFGFRIPHSALQIRIPHSGMTFRIHIPHFE